MRFAWGDFSTLARELLEVSKESEVPEAAIRGALGRSYYAVFGVAREAARDRDIVIPQHSAHASLRRALATSSDPQDRMIARALSRLFRLRLEADYYATPGLPLTRELAEAAAEVADNALAILAQPIDEPETPEEPDRPQGRP